VDHVAHKTQLAFPGWTDDLPLHQAADVELWIVLANTGASGTFVETLGLTDSFTCHGQGTCLFARLEKYLHDYNFDRAHTGHLTNGRVPADIVLGARKTRPVR
jgi:hypothetical protein